MLWGVKRISAAAAALVTALLLIVALPGTAQAHNQLVSSIPADNQVLTTPPKEISLTFEESPVPDTTKMAATSSDGAVVALVAPTMKGAKQSAAWPAGTPEGTYTISWRSAADDGHVMSGSFTFGYTGTNATLGSTTTPTAAAESTPTEPVAGPGTQPAQPTSGETGFNWLWPASLVIAILVLATAAGLILRRIRSKDTGST